MSIMMKTKTKFKDDRINKPTFSLENLYVATIGHNVEYGKIYGIGRIIAYQKNENLYKYYKDVFTHIKYSYYRNNNNKNDELVAFNQTPLLFIFAKTSKIKEEILKNNYVTKEQLEVIYNIINEDFGFIAESDEVLKAKLPDNTFILNKNIKNQIINIGRDKELEKLYISLALNKKIILITGKKGIGKSNLVDYLTYLIEQEKTPEFLKDKKIIEVKIDEMNTDESIDNSISEIIKLAKEHNIILYLDNVKNIMNGKVLDTLLYEVERNGLKLIMTTNDNNYKNIVTDDRFEIIKLEELQEKDLKDIIKQTFLIRGEENAIDTSIIEDNFDDIATVMLATTEDENNYNIEVKDSNPGKVMSIIDKTLANCIGKDEKILTFDHLIEAFNTSNHINKNKKEKAILLLNDLKEKNNPKKDRKKLLMKKH